MSVILFALKDCNNYLIFSFTFIQSNYAISIFARVYEEWYNILRCEILMNIGMKFLYAKIHVILKGV